MLLGEFVAEDRERVSPGLDRELMAAHAQRRELRPPAVVLEELHADFLPVVLVAGAPQKDGRQRIMAVAEDIRLHTHGLADHPFDDEAAVVHRGSDMLDRQPRRGRSHRKVRQRRARNDGGRHATFEEADFAGLQPLGGRAADVLEGQEGRGDLVDRVGGKGRRLPQVAIDEDYPDPVGGSQIFPVRLHDGDGRRVGGRNQRERVLLEPVLLLPQHVVDRADVSADVVGRLVPEAGEPETVAMHLVERSGGPEFEAHRKHQAAAETGRKLQRAQRLPLQDFAPFGAVGDPLVVGGFGECDLHPEATLDLVFLRQPAVLQVPPGEGGKAAVEAGTFQRAPAIEAGAGRPGEEGRALPLVPSRLDERGPCLFRDAVDAEAAEAGYTGRDNPADPVAPFLQIVVRGLARGEIQEAAAARIRPDPGVGGDVAIAAIFFSHPVDDQIEHQPQAVALGHLREAGEAGLDLLAKSEAGIEAIEVA